MAISPLIPVPTTNLDSNSDSPAAGRVDILEVVNRQNFNKKVYLSQFASLQAAVTAIGGTPTTLVINTPFAMTADVVTPFTLTVNFESGGLITTTGYTLTINGPFYGSQAQGQRFAGTGTVVFGLNSLSIVKPELFGAISTAYNNMSYAAQNFVAITKAIASISAKGGIIEFGNGWYYVNDVISITTNWIGFRGVGGKSSSLSQGTFIATSATDKDVIQVTDTVAALEGFSMENITVFGSKFNSGTAGNGLVIKASNGRAISRPRIINCSFNYTMGYGILFDATTAGTFIFDDAGMDAIMTVGNALDGWRITGQVSQIKVGSYYTENNGNHGVSLIGGASGGTNNILFDRLTLSVVPAGYAGLNIEYANDIQVKTIYSEDVAGDNIRLRSVRNFSATGGSLQQVISTAYGVVIGVDAANHPNKNHYIDIPGWTNTTAQKEVDLTRYTGGVVVDGLTLGATANGPLTNADVNGYDTAFFLDSIKYLYPSTSTPAIAVQAAAGTGATATLLAGSTNQRGQIALTSGSALWIGGDQALVTFDPPFAVPPTVILSPASTKAANQQKTQGVNSGTVSKTGFGLRFVNAETAAGVANWNYTVTP